MTDPVIGTVFEVVKECTTHDTKIGDFVVVVAYAMEAGRSRMEAALDVFKAEDKAIAEKLSSDLRAALTATPDADKRAATAALRAKAKVSKAGLLGRVRAV